MAQKVEFLGVEEIEELKGLKFLFLICYNFHHPEEELTIDA